MALSYAQQALAADAPQTARPLQGGVERFLTRIALARESLRAGKGIRLEEIAFED
jgi:hypothetical protein